MKPVFRLLLSMQQKSDFATVSELCARLLLSMQQKGRLGRAPAHLQAA